MDKGLLVLVQDLEIQIRVMDHLHSERYTLEETDISVRQV